MVPMVANQFLPETTLETSHDCCWLQKNRYLPPPWDAVVAVVVVHAGSMRMRRHTNVPWCYNMCVRGCRFVFNNSAEWDSVHFFAGGVGRWSIFTSHKITRAAPLTKVATLIAAQLVPVDLLLFTDSMRLAL